MCAPKHYLIVLCFVVMVILLWYICQMKQVVIYCIPTGITWDMKIWYGICFLILEVCFLILEASSKKWWCI